MPKGGQAHSSSSTPKGATERIGEGSKRWHWGFGARWWDPPERSLLSLTSAAAIINKTQLCFRSEIKRNMGDFWRPS